MSKSHVNSDFTQQQSLVGLKKAKRMSVSPEEPPAEVKGYEIEKLLGQGSFGQVWQGRDLNTGRQVAIKFYMHRGSVDWNALDREVKHLVTMSTGRYIVQVLGVGWHSDPPYYVMEYFEHGSLEDMVRANGSLSIAATVSTLRELAEGLSFAHSKGVLHCDLKPANVMLDHDWRPRLADFGQSRMSHEQTPSLGTLFFMAPEQADLTAAPDAAWDVYALGAIAYCMLVGSPPYRSPNIIETLDSADSLNTRLHRYREVIRKSPKPRLHYRRRGIDKALCQIIDRCLAPDPKQRYSNAQQVIGALDNYRRARTRRPLYVLGILGPVLFVLVLLGFSFRSINVAKKESLERVQQLSLESNKFASQLAAKTLQSEIEALFRLVENEAQSPELLHRLKALCSASEDLLPALAQGIEAPEEKQTLLALPEQKRLWQYVSTRLQAGLVGEGRLSGATFDSLFITDARGTNVAAEFIQPKTSVEQSPVGRNFAYRSYFHGGRDDGTPLRHPSQYSPTRETHLSAPFRSTATLKWKVGISTPIWETIAENQPTTGTDATPLGVLVLTINLGNLDLLSGTTAQGQQDRFAVLVDGREGNCQGTLLQHPLLDNVEKNAGRGSQSNVVPQINLKLLTRLKNTGGVLDFEDPAANFDDGERFGGTWIAAMQPVQLKRNRSIADSQAVRKTSDLWVLVQERGATIAEPVTKLGARLQRESYVALGSLLAVVVVLWFFVLRLSQSKSSSDGSLFTPVLPNSALQSTVDNVSPDFK